MTCRDYNRPARGDFGYVSYTGDGSTATFTIGFDYPFKSIATAGASTPYVKVYVGDEEAEYVLASSNSVTITPTPSNASVIEIIRDSKLDDTLVDWNNGSALTASNLQLENDQHQFLLQELWMHLKALGCRLDEFAAEGGTASEYTATGDGSTTIYSLSPESGLSDPRVLVFINGIRQATNTYAVADNAGVSRVTFDEAPPSGAKLSFVVFKGLLIDYTLADGSVSTSKLADGAVTFVKTNFNATGSNNQALMKRSGSWTASNIDYTDVANFNTGVRLNTLSQMAAPTGSVSMNSQKITNLATPTSGNDAVNKTYADALVSGIVTFAKGSSALDGANPSRTTVALGWQPSVVFLYWDTVVRTSNSTQYDICCQTFGKGTGTEQRRTVSVKLTDGADETIAHSLQFTATGFTYTLDSWIATGNIYYVAIR
jgi:hypothetical protein